MRLTNGIVFILLGICMTGKTQTIEPCLPDKGIQTATVFAQIDKRSSTQNEADNYSEIIHFNTDGQPILIKNARQAAEHSREYEDGQLKYIITSRRELPGFYAAEQLDSLTAHASVAKDTAVITSHHADGRPKAMKGSDGTTLIFTYEGCREEFQTLLAANGDTIHQYQISYKDGVTATTNWTPFMSTKSTISTKYFAYKFNRHGHWIERKYRRREGVILENRKLTYY